MKLAYLVVLTLVAGGEGRPNAEIDNFSGHWHQFSRIKDLIDRINIKKFREVYDHEATNIEGSGLVEIDLTDEAIIEQRVISGPAATTAYAETTTAVSVPVHPTTAAADSTLAPDESTTPAPAPADPTTLSPTTASLQPTTTASLQPTTTASLQPTASTAVDETTVGEAEDTADALDDAEDTADALDDAEDTADALDDAEDTADALDDAEDTADALDDAEDAYEAALEAAKDEDNQVEDLDQFFVSQDTLSAAKRFGYKILLRKVGGVNVAVGKIKFTFPTYVQIQEIDSADTATTTAAGLDTLEPLQTTTTRSQAESALDGVEVVTEDIIEEEGVVTEDILEEEEVVTEGILEEVEVVTEDILREEDTSTEDSLAEVTSSFEIPAHPRVTSVLIPEISEISTETLETGTEAVVKDTVIAVEALAETKNELEISDSCSVPLEEIKSLVIGLASNIRDSTPLLMEIVAIGKSLRNLNDTAMLLRNGGDLLRLLEPFLESILPATSIPWCGDIGPSMMMISMSNIASQVDIVADNQQHMDSGKSADLHEAATSLQLAAWVLAQLQQSVYTFFDKDGICDESGNTSTTAILETLAKTMESYKPMLNVLGPKSGLADLKETIKAINRAVTILESVRPAGGLPGVSCRATLNQMATALEELADFVTNLNTNL